MAATGSSPTPTPALTTSTTSAAAAAASGDESDEATLLVLESWRDELEQLFDRAPGAVPFDQILKEVKAAWVKFRTKR